MIVELNISNFAIIDDLKINFTKGFNVLTGETGTGKSIIVEGIGMILGQRANRNMVRTGKEKSILEGIFYLDNPQKINMILENFGIDTDPSNYLLISREIHNNGRSISRVNGRTVTLTMLNRITSNLVDIHGQHEHQSLLDVENHIKLIDTFGNVELRTLLGNVKEAYLELLKEKKKLEELSLDTIERDREIDLLKYQIDEIHDANLLKYDEDEIMREYKKLSNIKEIGHNLGGIADSIGNENQHGISIISNISKCISNMKNIIKYDNVLEEYNNVLEYISFELQDLYRSILDYLENINIDEERLEFLEDRIDIINNLKRKYGSTIEDILRYKDSIEKRYEELLNNEKEVEKTLKRIEAIKDILSDYCNQLTEIRKIIGKKIEALITKELKDLNMENVIFKVDFKKLDDFTQTGWDRIEFLISTNKGEDLKPLSKIISGGEMSRIMLAFKRILADYDNIPCLIFDEIDTGISGRTAQIVGEKIKMISKKHQVICISHLPQIAALADTHFLIDKQINNDKTSTFVRKLKKQERIDELSRLLGGVDLTDTTKLHAKEMLEMSKKLDVKS
ncbi:DNA repair protein RecN [Clostridium sp. Cult1]|uniref:DNA repair protein RecN n=1 Tax=Clostridium sp. Cult1 TaxID=2079002 RepID=UPI001F01E501|nr:DNA repair protein RecN [Clostridium sp. Cult1]MCF6462035.1 DNA repair protein RecN [Clostridium sp. Cult1]